MHHRAQAWSTHKAKSEFWCEFTLLEQIQQWNRKVTPILSFMDAHRGIITFSPGRGFICPTTVAEEEDTMSALAVTRSLLILSGCSFNLNHTSVLPGFGKEGYSIPCPLPSKPRSQSVPQGFKTRRYIWLLTWPPLFCAITALGKLWNSDTFIH